MARLIGRDEAQAAQLLDAVGVRLHAVTDGDVAGTVLVDALPVGERQIRGEVDIPVPSEPHAGMGAWHVNAVNELHVVASGQGIMEFVTLDGVVSVVLEAGDVVEIRGAEHRYRPLTEQRWILRYAGPADGALEATETGRAAEPWPLP